MGPRLAGVFALVLAMAFAAAAEAQETEARDTQDQVIQKLADRVEALERQVAALKQVRSAQSGPSAIATAPSADTAQPDTSTQPDNASRFTFHGYADADFQRNVDGNAKKFELGEIDLFGTERLSPHLTALMELDFETDDQQLVAQVPVNVERLLLQYRGNNFFNLDIGSFRTAVGYYSTAYLRGAWLQTAISRPKMFTFEDQGGFLPLHAVGVSVNGKIPSGYFDLHYVLEMGSSRNYGNTAQLGLDESFNRATNLAIYSQPRGVPGLEIGFSTYHDRFSPTAGIQLDRSVWTVHVVYVRGRVEFLNEGLRFGLLGLATQGTATGLGFYSQLAYRVASSWKPYARVEYMNVYGAGEVDADTLYNVPWKTVYTGGVRYDLTESLALKFELGRETDYLRPSYLSTAVQLAFAF
jgi:hypothetical protein